jgi:hypothetical protein
MPGHAATQSGSHGVCSSLGDGADQAQSGLSVPSFKHVPSALPFEPPASAVLRPPDVAFASAAVPPAWAYRSVPLNLRHCVFLI